MKLHERHTRRTGAAEVADKVVTGATVLAGVRLAVIHVELTVLALKALVTVAQVGVDQVYAGSSVLAG